MIFLGGLTLHIYVAWCNKGVSWNMKLLVFPWVSQLPMGLDITKGNNTLNNRKV